MCILQDQARQRMMKQKGSDETDSYWDNLWGKPRDYQRSGMRFAYVKRFIVLIIGNYYNIS